MLLTYKDSKIYPSDKSSKILLLMVLYDLLDHRLQPMFKVCIINFLMSYE